MSSPLLRLSLLSILALSSCAADLGTQQPNCDEGQCDEASDARRLDHATRIRDAAAQSGMTNAVLLAGIGQVETTLTHCWSDARWACKGPVSDSCNGGPVISGSSDGACSLKQGGLGMFQFDAGTHSDTLARHGDGILTLEGNVRAVVPFLVTRVIESVDGIATEQEALDWMNSIRIEDGDPEFEKWLYFVSWRYNGCKGCTSQENKYRDGTHFMQRKLGAEFWGSAGDGSGGGFVPGDSFVGEDCSATPSVCDFSLDGNDSECLEWFDSDIDDLYGFCSVVCDGYCPDEDDKAPTFCSDFRNNPGMCASVPAAANAYCEDIPGTEMQVVPRYVLDSGAAIVWKGVCAPPGNETSCSPGGGQGGQCVDTDTMQCGGTLQSGLCPGGNNIKCCVD